MKFAKLTPRKPPKWLIDRFGPRLLRAERQIGVRLLRRGLDVVAPPLACGSYGCVFAVEGDETRVVKVTSDRHEGEYTAYIMALQRAGARTEEGLVLAVTVRIDGVWRLEEPEIDEDEEPPVFVILEERVLPSKECKVPKKIQSAADTYTDGWDLVMQASEIESTKRAAKTYVEAELLIADGLRALRRAGEEGKRVAALLDLVHEEQFPLTDMHRDNLCRRIYKGPNGAEPGQIVIIDFGVSEAGSPFGRSVRPIGSSASGPDAASGLGPLASGFPGPTNGFK